MQMQEVPNPSHNTITHHLYKRKITNNINLHNIIKRFIVMLYY